MLSHVSLLGADVIAGNATVGGKADWLDRLARLGFRIPPTVCIPAEALDRHLEEQGLKALERELPASAEELRVRVRELSLPAWLVEEFRAAVTQLLQGRRTARLAVRSSAVDEDSPTFSFAGQHTSYLGVRSSEAEIAVRQCWISLWSDRALAYRCDRGLSAAGGKMGIVIQRLIEARASAVAFTRHPVTGAVETVVAATEGLGEAIVSNLVEPDTWIMDGASLSVRETVQGRREYQVVVSARGGTQRIYRRRRSSGLSLSEGEARELAWLARHAELLLGGPLDIEAVIDNDGWTLLQARPITTLPRVAS